MDNEELLSRVDEKIAQADALIVDCKKLVEMRIDGASKLKRKVQAELDFLTTLKKKPKTLKPDFISSTNLTHLNALCQVVLKEPNVASILAPFPRDDQSNLVVDIVKDDGATWMKVVARSARGLHFTWAGEAGYRERTILDQADDYVCTASHHPHFYETPKIIFVFCAGVTQPIVDDLRQRFNIESRGDIVTIDPSWGFARKTDQDSSSENGDEAEDSSSDSENFLQGNDSIFEEDANTNRPLNLDITALLAYVSSLTNGGANFKFKEPLLDEQAAWERERPVLPLLSKFMDCENRKLICCHTARQSFLDILNTVGGESERSRAEMLLKRIEFVEDRISTRVVPLKIGGKIKQRSKIIFGTGDFYQAVTLTANRGFIQAACNQGIRFAAVIHESRALSEQKQQHAEPLTDAQEI